MQDSVLIPAEQPDTADRFYEGRRQLRLFGILNVALFLITIALLAVPGWTVHAMLEAIGNNDATRLQHLAQTALAFAPYAKLVYATLLLGWLAFFAAMFGPRKALSGLVDIVWKYGFGVTIGSMVVPFWSFYRPWVGLAEIDKAVVAVAQQGRLPEDWRKKFSLATLLLALVVIVMGLIMFMSRTHPSYLPKTRDQLIEILGNAEISVAVSDVCLVLTTVALAAYLMRQARNLRKAGAAFNLA